MKKLAIVIVGLTTLAGTGCGGKPLTAEEARAEIGRLGGKIDDKAMFQVNFTKAGIKDEDMGKIVQCMNALQLSGIALYDTQVTESGLAKLKDVKQLRTLGVPSDWMKFPVIKQLQQAHPGLSIMGTFEYVGPRINKGTSPAP
jgi:hypothetical protein